MLFISRALILSSPVLILSKKKMKILNLFLIVFVLYNVRDVPYVNKFCVWYKTVLKALKDILNSDLLFILENHFPHFTPVMGNHSRISLRNAVCSGVEQLARVIGVET